ncbi:hypothetical protein LXL04_025615 [Taraxacum kok-saghyz]
MDNRFSKHDTGVAIKSTRGLLLSKPYDPLSATSSKNNGIKREASSGPKLIETIKEILNLGAQMIQVGSQRKIFRKTFGIREGEKLLKASQCNLYTTAGAIAGILFVSTERVAFCSYKSIEAYSTTGKLINFQYKVSIPLGKIKGSGCVKASEGASAGGCVGSAEGRRERRVRDSSKQKDEARHRKGHFRPVLRSLGRIVVVAGRVPVVTTEVTGEHRCILWLLVVITRKKQHQVGRMLTSKKQKLQSNLIASSSKKNTASSASSSKKAVASSCKITASSRQD